MDIDKLEKLVNNIVWWIPFKKLRNNIRTYLNYINKNLQLINHINSDTILNKLSETHKSFDGLYPFILDRTNDINKRFDGLYPFILDRANDINKRFDEIYINKEIAYDSYIWCIYDIRNGILQDTNFYNTYKKLISNLDIESSNLITNIISKISIYDNINDYIYFYYDELSILKKIDYEHRAKIIKIDKEYYMYNNKYILNSNNFEIINFYDRMYIDSLTDINYIKNKAIIDAGAWIGDTALILSEYTNDKVYAFEPLSINYQHISNNMKINNINNVIPINMALGDENKDISIFGNGNINMMPSMISTNFNNNTIEENVKMITLDSFVENNNIEVGLIKTDLEGFEQAFLQGALNTIKKQKPILIISIYHNYNDFFYIKPMIEALNLGYTFKVKKGHELLAVVGTLLIAEPRPDQTRPDQTRPDQTRPDQTRPDQTKLSTYTLIVYIFIIIQNTKKYNL